MPSRQRSEAWGLGDLKEGAMTRILSLDPVCSLCVLLMTDGLVLIYPGTTTAFLKQLRTESSHHLGERLRSGRLGHLFVQRL